MDIVNRLGYSRASVQRTMKKLVENGIIERKGGKRFGFWEIHNKKRAKNCSVNIMFKNGRDNRE